MNAAADSLPSRRRLVFAALTTAVVVAAVFTALLPGLRQKRLIDEIEANGGRVELETIFPEWLETALASILGDRHQRMYGRIQWVHVKGDWFDDYRMAQADGFRNATHVALGSTSLSKAGFALLVPNENLEHLWLSAPAIDGDWAGHFPAISSLRLLGVIGLLPPFSVVRVDLRFPNLKHLYLLDCRVDGGGLKQVASLPMLEHFCLQRSEIEEADFVHLAGHSRLKILELGESSVGDAAMSHLARCPNLAMLLLHDTRVSDQGMEALAKGRALRWLDLTRTSVTTAGVQALAELPGLYRLVLADTSVTEDVVPVLLGMPALESVDLDGTAVSREERERLKHELELRSP